MSTSTIPPTYRLRVLAQGGRKAEIDAPSGTTVGEQLNEDNATLAQVIGQHDPDKLVVVHLKKASCEGSCHQPQST